MIDTRFSEDWSDDDETDDSFDETDDDESLELVPCPECGEPIYEEAQQCPECGSYVIHRSDRWSGRPPWWVILGLLGAGLAMLGFLF